MQVQAELNEEYMVEKHAINIEIFKIKPCGGRDLNPRTPAGRDPESRAFS